jgi:hypothetical protein
MQAKTPTAPAAPVLAPSQVTIAGSPLGGAQAVYNALRAQRQELQGQMEDLQSTRYNLARQLDRSRSGVTRTGVEQRIAGIDARIASMDKQIADADAQVARAAAIPGAVIEPPRLVRQGPNEGFVLTGVFMVVVLFPFSVALAIRMLRRGARAVTAFPKEIVERLARLEQSADATAIEVERIGEGQRFLTRLFTEGNGFRALSAPVGEAVERKLGDAGSTGR